VQNIERTQYENIIQREEQHINRTKVVPTVQREIRNIEQVKIEPSVQREEQHITQKEIVPSVQTQVQNINEVQVVPMIQKVEEHTTQRQIVSQEQHSVQNQERTIIQPMIQKIETHTTQRELQPTIQTQTQNSEHVKVQPMILREEQHTTQTQVAPELRHETQNIQKKVIQPIIKDVIQPVKILVKPVVQEGIKPTIFQGQSMHQAINQGTQNLPVSYHGTNYAQEVMSGTLVNQSIYKTSTLPVQYKPVLYKPEIGAGVTQGLAVGTAAYGVNTVSMGLINGGTTVKPSIVRNSVLPTINQGVSVLNTVYGPTSQTFLPVGSVYNLGVVQGGLTTTTSTLQNAINLGTTVSPTVNLGTTTLGTTTGGQYGVVGAITTSQYGTGVAGAQTYNGGKIMGVGGGVEDFAADVTYSTKPDSNQVYQ
jgi:hypothetical protein